MKKLSALLLSVTLIFLFAACNKTAGKSDETLTTEYISEEAFAETDNGVTEKLTETFSRQSDTEEISATDATEIDGENPESLSKEQIIDYYKKSAALSHSKTTSQHQIEIKDISVNNGEFEKVFEFITPIMSKLLANNSSDKAGITGGYQNLCADDVASAKAYKSGSDTVVELVLNKQVSGAKEDALSGPVGHAITAVGDISVVTEQLKELGLPLEISDESIRIVYTEPTVKVVINDKGMIINGTWRYTVAINLTNYKAFGKPVDSTVVVMDNTLTVNGGFKK